VSYQSSEGTETCTVHDGAARLRRCQVGVRAEFKPRTLMRVAGVLVHASIAAASEACGEGILRSAVRHSVIA